MLPNPTRRSSRSASSVAGSPQSGFCRKASPAFTFSTQSSEGSTRTSWNVRARPSRAILWAGSPSIDFPASRMAPASGFRAPERRLSAVVLPEPFGPIRPTISDLPTVIDQGPFTATRPPNRRVRPSTSRRGRGHAGLRVCSRSGFSFVRSTEPGDAVGHAVDDQHEDEAEEDAEIVREVGAQHLEEDRQRDRPREAVPTGDGRLRAAP